MEEFDCEWSDGVDVYFQKLARPSTVQRNDGVWKDAFVVQLPWDKTARVAFSLDLGSRVYYWRRSDCTLTPEEVEQQSRMVEDFGKED